MDSMLSQWTSGRRAILVGCLTAVLLLLTAGSIGLTSGEPPYIAASESYNSWFHRLVFGPHGVLHPSVIESSWNVDIEQPPLDKAVSGLVWGVTKGIFGDLLAHRLANILLFSVMTALLYHMVSDELGGVAGIASVAAMLAMPRFFFHAHLSALDVPAASMILIVTYVFWRTKESARFRYTVGLGIVWGLALATRINTLWIMPILFVWMILFRRKMHLVLRLLVSTVIGLPVLFLAWPWLYYDTADRLKEFIKVVVSSPFPQYYLGNNSTNVPWHFPFVMAAAVIPVGILVLCLLGVLRTAVRRRDRAFGSLLILGAIVFLGILASGQVRVYDNDRMLMPAFPFLAILAGSGFAWLGKIFSMLVQRFRIPQAAAQLLTVAAACVIWIPVTISMISYAPHWLSYYSEGVGGLPGAVASGFETAYWCEGFREAVQFINENAEPGDTVWVQPYSFDVLVYYQKEGILRNDVLLANLYPLKSVFEAEDGLTQATEGFSQADFVILQHRQAFLYDESDQPTDVLLWIADRSPALRIERQGTPILDVYTNP